MARRPHKLIFVIAIAACFEMGFAPHRTHAAPVDEFQFNRAVQPLLARRCFACHGPEKAESGLRLNDGASAMSEADSGIVVISPGDADGSELIRRITSTDENERMPPEGEPLTAEEIDVLRAWIDQGAKFEPHWAFTAVVHPLPPAVSDEQWVRNEIDRFILAKLEARGLRPAPPADRIAIARRVYYDLTGLPPTLEEVEAFVADARPDAYKRLIDKLLASPHYGERWARHWLDVVRYAETNSFERDDPKPFVWKYRDYVIRSFNNDKPYDQFILEQLAGDELDAVTPESMAATGYYRLGTWDDEPADPLQSRFDDLDSIISTTGQVFLGLTIGCARCHDHKIDPIPQTNYYEFLSFFADVTPYADIKRRDANEFSLWDASPESDRSRREALNKRKEQLADEMHALEQVAIKRMSAPDQRRSEGNEREALLKEKLKENQSAAERERYLALASEHENVIARIDAAPKPEWVLSLAKCEATPPETHIHLRGNPHVPGAAVAPNFPELFGDAPPTIVDPPPNARSSGRRRVLAEWIARPDNMLTARVIVNRVWQHHFGRGVVRSPNNFGQLGIPPTHPELLEWMAAWFVEHGWRFKELHRLILLSNTYQMASIGSPEALASDPDNDLFWRFDMRRLSAEEIRDSVLVTSGEINLELHGPSIFPPLSDEVLHTQSRPGLGWKTSNERDSSRRSIYIHVKRSLIPPELAEFDFPDTDTSCEARFNTIQPGQALNLLHGQFIQRQANKFAERVTREVGEDNAARVPHALRLALARPPDDALIFDGLEMIKRLSRRHGMESNDAFRQFCLMVFNLNEFVYID